MSEDTATAYLPFARELCLRAAELALDWQGRASVHYKADRSVVTEADIAVQRLVRDAVGAAFPSHGVVGEERVKGSKERPEDHDGLWIVDPIDGTDAFSRGLPMWAISIGLYLNGRPTLGVIAQPATGDLYWGVAGGGAFLNGRPIHIDDGPDLGRQSLTLVPSNTHHLARPVSQGKIQGYGSNCLHLLYVARGSAQATVLGSAYVWDYFAAAIILEGAGGRLFSLFGEPLDLTDLSAKQAHLKGAIACHPDRIPAVLAAFDVELPTDLHGFSGKFTTSRYDVSRGEDDPSDAE